MSMHENSNTRRSVVESLFHYASMYDAARKCDGAFGPETSLLPGNSRRYGPSVGLCVACTYPRCSKPSAPLPAKAVLKYARSIRAPMQSHCGYSRSLACRRKPATWTTIDNATCGRLYGGRAGSPDDRRGSRSQLACNTHRASQASNPLPS